MQPSWFVLLPPLLVVISVLLTRRMIASFLIGIVSAALIAKQGNIMQAIWLGGNHLLASAGLNQLYSLQALSQNWNLCIFMFLLCLGVVISLLRITGAAQAYARLAKKFVHNKVTAQLASMVLSLFFFIDDYFSVLTVGSVMRPITDSFGVSPVKLAFLVTVMASPLVILSPISSWVGEVIIQLKQVGVGLQGQQVVIEADPYYVFIRSIPFIIYPLILIFSTLYIVMRKISYGPMKRYEDEHETKEYQNKIMESVESSFFDFLLPLILLIVTVFCLLLYTGDYSFFGGAHSFMQALQAASVHLALLGGGCVTMFVTILNFLVKKKIGIATIKGAIIESGALMLPSIIMLIHAWTLGTLLKNDLQTGSYIAQIASSIIQTTIFPVICFVFSSCIAAMIGSAWATIGLMFPIVIGILKSVLSLPPAASFEMTPILFPIIGATLSGAIMGTHCCLISDNPIMASASTRVPHLALVKSLLWYVLPIGFATGSAYLMLGFILPISGLYLGWFISLAVGLIVSVILLEALQKVFG